SSGILAAGVEVQLWQMIGPTSWYFDGGAWTTTVSTLTASGSNWSVAAGLVPTDVEYASLAGDNTFYVRARVHDKSTLPDGSVSQSSGNLSGWMSPQEFIVDGTPPVSTMTWPVNGGYASAISSITGTANAALSGVKRVEVRITTAPATGPDWNGTGYSFAGVPIWNQATAAANWEYTSLTNAFFTGNRYYIYSHAVDNAGNPQSPDTAFSVLYDTTVPSVSLARPAPNPADPPYYSNNSGSPTQILLTSGTVNDNGTLPSGIVSVMIAISSGPSETMWWNAATNLFDQPGAIFWSTNVYVSGTSWSYSPASWATTAFTNQTQYRLYVKAVDRAGVETAAASQIFRYDVSTPTAVVSLPADATNVKSLTAFSGGTGGTNGLGDADGTGGASDAGTPTGRSGVRRAYIAVQKLTNGDNTWWNWGSPGSFSLADQMPLPTIAWTPVKDLGLVSDNDVSWSTPTPTGMIVSSNSYRVVVKAADWAGNEIPDALAAAGGAGNDFYFDNQAPTTTLTTPGFAYVGGVSTFTGSVSDAASGMSKVQIAIRLSNGNCWNGADFSAACVPGHYQDAALYVSSWSYRNAALSGLFQTDPDPRRYQVFVAGTDNAYNINRSTTVAPGGSGENFIFTIDHYAPVSITTFPASANTRGPVMTLAGTAQDVGNANSAGVGNIRLKVLRLNSAGTTDYWDFVSNWQPEPGSAFIPVYSFSGGSGDSLAAWLSTTTAPLPEAAFLEGYRYSIVSRAEDLSNPINYQAPVSTYVFIVDRTTPTVAIAAPPHLSYFKTLSSLSGTVSNTAPNGGVPSPLDYIQLDLSDTDRSPNQFWNFNTQAWQGAYVSTTIAGTTSWSMAAGFLPVNTPVGAANSWSVGRTSATFVLRALAADLTGNTTSFAMYQSTFTLDRVDPDSNITLPLTENGDVTSIASIEGTAADFTAGISTVQIRIYQPTGGAQDASCSGAVNNDKYWNGNAWQAGEVWLGVNALGGGPPNYAWTLNSSAVGFSPVCFYIVKSSAVDNADNREPLNADAAAGSRRFRFMPPPAVTAVTTPASNRKQQNLTLIEGTANVNTTSLQLTVRRSTDNFYWNFVTPAWQSAFSSVTITGASNWSYSTNIPPLVHGSSYVVRSSGTNSSNIPESAPVTNLFYSDQAGPNTTVDFPNASFHGNLPTVYGIAQDLPFGAPETAGIQKVRLEIQAVNGEFSGKFWDNAASTFTTTWSDNANNEAAYHDTATSSYTYTVSYPTAAWINGVRYAVEARSLDKAYVNATLTGNQGGFSAARTFDYDVVVPTAVVSAVAAGQKRSSVAIASGTIAEKLVIANDGSQSDCAAALKCDLQIAAVRVHIYEQNLDRYWDGAGWSGVPTTSTNAFVHKSSWTLTALPSWTDAFTYTLWSQAEDKAGGVQQNFSGNGSSVTFTVDQTAPTAAITAPAADVQLNAWTSVTGSADDPNYATGSGIAGGANVQVQVSYLLDPDTYYYDGGVTFSSTTSSRWNSPTWSALGLSSGTWNFAPAGFTTARTSDKNYTVKARVQDNARPTPNPSDLTANIVARFNVIFDTTPPAAVVQMPDEGAFYEKLLVASGTVNADSAGIDGTNASRVNLEIRDSMGDGFGAGDQYWNGAAFTTTVDVTTATVTGGPNGTLYWEYTAAVPYQNRQYRITAKSYDRAGNIETALSSAAFTFNRQAPTTALSLPAESASGRYSALPTISGTASDSGSGALGIKEVHLRVRNNTENGWWNGASTSAPVFPILDASMETAWKTVLSTNALWTGWSLDFSWTSGMNYTVVARSKDNGDVLGPAYSTGTFTYDTDKPESTVLFPAVGSFIKSFDVGASSITGTYTETGVPAGNWGTVLSMSIAI
ncbi:MAG: hypothetical protein AAB262_02480, partial [Elusimicrobiota bacterium]